MSITHLFFDIGGVLGTNAWDHEQRGMAFAHFGLDPVEFEDRHKEIAGSLETGRATLDEYLTTTVFYRPRAFTASDFRAFMFALSAPYPPTIEIARALAGAGRWRLATLNNESTELNVFRLRHFGLTEVFTAFYSSCWLGVQKPSRQIFDMALAISQADATSSVFIDDRTRNLDTARALGMQTVHYIDADQLRAELTAFDVTL